MHKAPAIRLQHLYFTSSRPAIGFRVTIPSNSRGRDSPRTGRVASVEKPLPMRYAPCYSRSAMTLLDTGKRMRARPEPYSRRDSQVDDWDSRFSEPVA